MLCTGLCNSLFFDVHRKVYSMSVSLPVSVHQHFLILQFNTLYGVMLHRYSACTWPVCCTHNRECGCLAPLFVCSAVVVTNSMDRIDGRREFRALCQITLRVKSILQVVFRTGLGFSMEPCRNMQDASFGLENLKQDVDNHCRLTQKLLACDNASLSEHCNSFVHEDNKARNLVKCPE